MTCPVTSIRGEAKLLTGLVFLFVWAGLSLIGWRTSDGDTVSWVNCMTSEGIVSPCRCTVLERFDEKIVYWVLLKYGLREPCVPWVIWYFVRCFIGFLDTFSKMVGPNKFPLASEREGLILVQANLHCSTLMEWHVQHTIHRALCIWEIVSSGYQQDQTGHGTSNL